MPKPAILMIAALSLAALATPDAQVPNPDLQIQLGGIDLVLGMAQDDALRKLSAVYDVSFDNTKWNVTKKGTSYRPLGSVSFRMERLVWVNKEWFDYHDESATAHAMAVRSAIQAVAGQGRGCVVSAEPNREPTAAMAVRGVPASAETIIKCGRRRVEMISSQDPRVVPQVWEILE